jgi:hypothetical protein
VLTLAVAEQIMAASDYLANWIVTSSGTSQQTPIARQPEHRHP